MKIGPMGAELFYVEGRAGVRTDGQTWRS